MRSVFVHGELSSTELQSLLSAVGADGQGVAGYAFGDVRVVLIVGQKFFFRTNDHLGLVVLATTNGTSQRIDISVAGRGAGAFGTLWGAGDDFENDTYNALVQLLNGHSFQFQDAGAPPPS